MPSELVDLKWGDIRWDDDGKGEGRIVIHSPKTEAHEGGDVRTIPFFPELAKPLTDLFAEAPEGGEYIFGRVSNSE